MPKPVVHKRSMSDPFQALMTEVQIDPKTSDVEIYIKCKEYLRTIEESLIRRQSIAEVEKACAVLAANAKAIAARYVPPKKTKGK